MAATLATRLHAHFAPLHDQPTPDADLLARFALHGDSGAFAALVKRHGGMVAAVCRKRLGHAQDAEDAAQAVFLALARKADRVHGAAPVAAWLYGAAVKACREVVRRNRRKPWVPLTTDVPGDSVLSADHEAVAAVLDEVANLSDAHRAAVVLCELEGCPRGLAARRLGIAEGTLSSRLAAARRRLADRLTRRGFAPTALATLAGLAVGSPSFAFDLPSVTPIVQRITEAIVTTSIAWKLKLFAVLGATTASLGLALAGGEGPKPTAPPTPVVAKVAEPSFVFATVTEPSADEGDPSARSRSLVISTLGLDGVAGSSRTIDTAALAARIPGLKEGERRVIAADKFYVHPIEVGPDGRALAFSALNPTEVKNRTSPILRPIVEQLTQRKQTTYLANPAGTTSKLSEWRGDAPMTFWSPDSATLYYTAIDTKNLAIMRPPFLLPLTLYTTTRIDVATGRHERLAVNPNTRPLAVTPDGKSFLASIASEETFFSGSKFRLCLTTLPSDAGEPAKTRFLGEVPVNFDFHEAVFSPDGKRAIVSGCEIVPYPADQLPAKERPNDAKGVSYCPVRRYNLVDLDAGTMTRLSTQPACVPDFGRGVQWSPDGKRVAFTDAKGWKADDHLRQAVEPFVMTCDPDGGNPAKVAMPAQLPQVFRVIGYGPQFVAWK